jgi:hypothetical protein
MAALLAADHAALGKGQSAHRHHYRRIKGEYQAIWGIQQPLSLSLQQSRAKPRDLRFSSPSLEMFFDRGSHGPFGPPKEMKTASALRLLLMEASPFRSHPLSRPGGPTRQTSAQPGRAGTQLRSIAQHRRCGTARAGSSWKCFSTERSALALRFRRLVRRVLKHRLQKALQLPEKDQFAQSPAAVNPFPS